MTALTGAANTDLFGANERRIDGRDKVSGRAFYTADIRREEMLYAAFVLSPFARANIRSIDTGSARAMPGVRAVLTAADIGLRLFGRQIYDMPVLAQHEVRFVGERVAAIAADTRQQAEDAARAIIVEYDELPPVLDCELALAPDAPTLHPSWPDYHFPANSVNPLQRPHPNVQGLRLIERGETDLASVFRDCHRTFEHTFTYARQHAGFIEPRSTLVWIDDADVTHVHSPNKSPFDLRTQLARVAGVRIESIVIEPSAIGGDFGGKGLTVDEFPCYFLARATRRPVRFVEQYSDELRGGPTRHRAVMRLKTGVGADGRFQAHSSSVIYDGGAYAAGKPVPWLVPGNGYATIPYRVPNVRLEMVCSYTNTPPAAHVRGPGEVQTAFAWEQHVDAIAKDLGIDPIELRLLNVVRGLEESITGEPIRSAAGILVLQTLRGELQRFPMPQPGYGRGIALTCSPTGGGKTSVRMRLLHDGSVEVLVGVTDQGAGAFTTIRRVAAVELGVAEERISVLRGNTRDVGNDPGVGHSRVTHIVGRATQLAAQELRRLLEADTNLQFPLETVGEYSSGPHASDHSFAGLAVEASVDAQTGAVKVHEALIVADVSQIINPVAHQGQIDGGFAFGFGNALMEELAISDSGRIESVSFADYKIPTIADVPPLRTVIVQSESGDGPFGAKMIGELSIAPVSPAIANAIHSACGARIYQAPMTAELVYATVKKEAVGSDTACS